MKRKTLRILAATMLAFAATTLATAAAPSRAQAHVLERDGDISAVLHIPPDDSPRSNEQTSINLAFATNRADFNIADYELTLGVVRSNRTIETVTMGPLDGSATNATASVRFPEAGSYQLSVTGKPAKAGRPFTISFSVRASSQTSGQQSPGPGLDFWVLSIGSMIILIMIAIRGIRTGGKYAGS